MFDLFFFSILTILDVAKFILVILLVYFMEKGDLEKFEDFLECQNV